MNTDEDEAEDRFHKPARTHSMVNKYSCPKMPSHPCASVFIRGYMVFPTASIRLSICRTRLCLRLFQGQRPENNRAGLEQALNRFRNTTFRNEIHYAALSGLLR